MSQVIEPEQGYEQEQDVWGDQSGGDLEEFGEIPRLS